MVVHFTIDGVKVEGEEGQTILRVAEKYDIKIPTFCYHPRLKITGQCRMCIVEVDGTRVLQASCSTPIREGMVVHTHSKRVIDARRIILELLLANHDLNCPTCRKNLHCKLQSYSKDLMIEDVPFKGVKKHYEKDTSSPSIHREPDKCILCGRCVRVCNDVQTVYAIDNYKRGFWMGITPPFNHKLVESSCINCGQCVVNCPVGALTEKSDIHAVVEQLRLKEEGKSKKHLVVQVAPSIRATLGEEFGMEPGTIVAGRIVTALKRMGFDKVFDTDLCADMTIVEEATEFVKRFTSGDNLPMITTCCPAWIKFGEQYYFDELSHMSTCMSPQAMMARTIRTYYAQKIGIDPKDIYLVDIMPCTAKKFEVDRPEFAGDVDEVLTTIELARMIKMFDIDFVGLEDTEFDNPLGEATGAGAIFGRSGGVMEAALRTAADMVTGQDLQNIEYEKVRGMATLKEAELELAGKKIKIAVVHTIGEARKIMDTIRAGTCPYHFIEIMACYGGCVGGGGQPAVTTEELLPKRAEALNRYDRDKPLRKSHKNPTLIRLYNEYIGEFGGHKAHEILHTHYTKRDFIG